MRFWLRQILSMLRTFFNCGKWKYGGYGQTYWKILSEPWADVYFKLGEYQSSTGMVLILVRYKNAYAVFNFLSSSLFLCLVVGLFGGFYFKLFVLISLVNLFSNCFICWVLGVLVSEIKLFSCVLKVTF